MTTGIIGVVRLNSNRLGRENPLFLGDVVPHDRRLSKQWGKLCRGIMKRTLQNRKRPEQRQPPQEDQSVACDSGRSPPPSVNPMPRPLTASDPPQCPDPQRQSHNLRNYGNERSQPANRGGHGDFVGAFRGRCLRRSSGSKRHAVTKQIRGSYRQRRWYGKGFVWHFQHQFQIYNFSRWSSPIGPIQSTFRGNRRMPQ